MEKVTVKKGTNAINIVEQGLGRADDRSGCSRVIRLIAALYVPIDRWLSACGAIVLAHGNSNTLLINVDQETAEIWDRICPGG